MLKKNYFNSKLLLSQVRFNSNISSNNSLENTPFSDQLLVVEPKSNLDKLNILKQYITNHDVKHIVCLGDLSQLKENYNFQEGIYIIFIFNDDGSLDFYIGSSQNMRHRIRDHVRLAQNGDTGCKKLYNKIRAHGVEKFFVGVLELQTGLSLLELQTREMELILLYDAPLNIKKGSLQLGNLTNSQCKPVSTIHVDTKEITNFVSISAAERQLKVSNTTIIDAIKNKSTLLGNFRVFFTDQPIDPSMVQRVYTKRNPKPVFVEDIETGVITSFKTQTKAAEFCGVYPTTVSDALKSQNL